MRVIPAAAPEEARAHFVRRLSLETDCADVQEAMTLAGGMPPGTLFVVYWAGPHCNGGDRGALRLAELGRPVNPMIGGMTGWADEGFADAVGERSGSVLDAVVPVTQAD